MTEKLIEIAPGTTVRPSRVESVTAVPASLAKNMPPVIVIGFKSSAAIRIPYDTEAMAHVDAWRIADLLNASMLNAEPPAGVDLYMIPSNVVAVVAALRQCRNEIVGASAWGDLCDVIDAALKPFEGIA